MKNLFKNLRTRASALLVAMALSLTVAAPAFAADGVGTVVSAAITAAGPEVTLVIGSMATALVIIVAWKLIKKAFA